MEIKEISKLLEKLYSKPHTETFIKEVEYPAKECLKKNMGGRGDSGNVLL